MPNLLKQLKVNAISVVDRGSNPGAKTVLMKIFGGEMTKEELLKKFKEIGKKFGLGDADVTEDILKIEEANVPNLEEVQKSLDETIKRIGQLEVAKTLSDAIGKASIDISKAETVEVVEKIEGEIAKLDKSDSRIAILTEALVEKKKKIAAAMAEGKEGEDSPMPEVAKQITEVLKANNELKTKVEKMEKDNAVEAILKSDLKGIDVPNAREMAESIYKAKQSNPEATNALVTLIKAQAEQIKVGNLFKINGAGGDLPAGGTEEKVKKMAKERAEASAGKETVEKAYDEILKADPKLYEAIMKEARG